MIRSGTITLPKSYRQFLKTSSILLSFVFINSQAHSIGGWTNLIRESKDEAAKVFALKKLQKYQYATEDRILEVVNYAKEQCPELNSDMLGEGLKYFFNSKTEKWQNRSHLMGRPAKEDISNSTKLKSIFIDGPQNDQEWEQVLNIAVNNYDALSFQAYAKKGLDVIVPKARASLQSDGALSNEALLKHASPLTTALTFLQSLNLNKELERYKKLQLHLINKQQDLMGITVEHKQKTFSSGTVLAVIDVEFKIKEYSYAIFGVEFLPEVPKWNNTAPIHNARKFGHGDLMMGLAKTFSPNVTHHPLYYSTTEGHSDPLDLNHYSDKALVPVPVVFNCSFIPTGVHYYLKKTQTGIQLDPHSGQTKAAPEEFEILKRDLVAKFPGKSIDGPLDKRQLTYLKERENKSQKSVLAPQRAKKLVIGPEGNQTHLLCSSPHNEHGPLVKKGFHQGWIKLLDDDVTKERALIALNYNFFKGRLEEASHSAGQYKDMAVSVPAAIVSVSDDQEGSFPHFFWGGHSSATLILSSVTSLIRGNYPYLNHLQVKEAILKGANRNFVGYDENLHGKGMLNLKGALEVAADLARRQAKKKARMKTVQEVAKTDTKDKAADLERRRAKKEARKKLVASKPK